MADRTSANPRQATTSPPATTVECGYCSATMAVNSSSGEVREHKRDLTGRKARCIGSRQPAFIYPGNLQAGDDFQVVGHHARAIVAARPTVPADSNVWTIPLTTGGNFLHLPGNTLLRLWTREAGER